MHHYYHTDGMTDLDVLRSDARARAEGKGIHVLWSEDSTLHLHPAREIIDGVPRDINCVGLPHELYEVGGVMKEFTGEEPKAPSQNLKLVEIERTKDEIVWRIEEGGVAQAREFTVGDLNRELGELDIPDECVRLFVHSPVVGEPSIRLAMDIRQ